MARLTVPASAAYLANTRAKVRDLMLTVGMDARTDDAVLAVNEAMTPNGITITVCDTGRGPGDWRDTAGAGFGTAIMAKLTDALAINGQPGGGTMVRLTFDK